MCTVQKICHKWNSLGKKWNYYKSLYASIVKMSIDSNESIETFTKNNLKEIREIYKWQVLKCD